MVSGASAAYTPSLFAGQELEFQAGAISSWQTGRFPVCILLEETQNGYQCLVAWLAIFFWSPEGCRLLRVCERCASPTIPRSTLR